MQKNIDYKNLYLKAYKNLPTGYFYTTLIIMLLATVVLFIVFVTEIDEGIAILILLGGTPFSFGLAYLIRYAVAVYISQKIVVADTLLSMNKQELVLHTEEELPEM